MSITVADMMPGTLNCARNVMPVHPGEDVLLIADTTTNPDIAQAYKIAYESEGGKVSILTIPATSAGGSSHEITHHTLYGRYNKVVVEALKGADLGINLSGFADMHGIFGAGHTFFGMKPTDYWEKYKTRILSVTIACKEQLASDWATYPQPLLDYIEYRAHKQVEEIAAGDMDHIKLHITDPEGTDFSLEGFQLCTKGSLNKPIFRPGAPFGSALVGALPYVPTPNAEGTIVSTSIHTGPLPRIKATVKDGRVVALEGGGEIAKIWLADWEKCKNADSEGRYAAFGVPPGPGVNWLEELMWGLHPRAFRVGYKYRYEGSETFQAWVGGTRRSGVIHFGMGGGKDEFYRHRDFEIFTPTMTLNGVTVIKDGRLCLLDDPDVIKEAEKYGDPAVLLQEKWIPDPKNPAWD